MVCNYCFLRGSFLTLTRPSLRNWLQTPPLPKQRYIAGFVPGWGNDELFFAADLERDDVKLIYRGRWLADAAGDDGLDHVDYATWVIESDLPAGQEAASEDADGDGFSNLWEYIHRTSARDAGMVPRFHLELIGSDANWTTLVHTLPAGARLALVRPQVSTDLDTWFDLPPESMYELRTETTESTRIEWRFETLSGSRVFFRERFELP